MRALPALLIAAAGVLAALPAAARVASVTSTGFTVEDSVIVAAEPAAVYAAIGDIGGWWDPAHSYSGKADNLSISLAPGGCFCERLEGGGGVEHMRVVLAWPARLVRLSGALGPLQAEGVAGALDWVLELAPGGTRVTQRYVVGGYLRPGADALAGPVDAVLAAQLVRLKAHAERAKGAPPR